MYKQITHS